MEMKEESSFNFYSVYESNEQLGQHSALDYNKMDVEYKANLQKQKSIEQAQKRKDADWFYYFLRIIQNSIYNYYAAIHTNNPS